MARASSASCSGTNPALGPKHGQLFSLVVGGVKLPPDGSPSSIVPKPDSYSCSAKLAGKPIRGLGTDGCSWLLPKKSRGKTLTVVVTAGYEGSTTTVPYSFVVS